MKQRKGLGKGLGMGYKNIVPIDSHIHSLSAKGVKSKRPMMMYAKGVSAKEKERLVKLALDRDDITAKELKAIEDYAGSQVEEIEEWYDEKGFLLVKMDDGTSYVVAPSDDEAERLAIERVKEDLENEPELFSQSWLQNFISMSDTDRRIIAGEESDNIEQNMDEKEILEETDMQEDWDELEEEKDELEEEINTMTANSETDAQIKEELDEKESRLDEIEKEQEKIVDDAREKFRDDKYDEIYDALEDPVEYFVEEQGIYTKEDLMKQSFISIDYDEASEDAVSTDGWAHFLSRYDGNYEEIDGGKVVWRED